MLHLTTGERLFGAAARCDHVDERGTRRTHRTAHPLGPLPSGAAEARGDDRQLGVREVDPLVADTRHDEDGESVIVVSEPPEQRRTLGVWRFAADERGVYRIGNRRAVVEVLDEDE